MNDLKKSIKNLSNLDLYINYPFSFKFAKQVTFSSRDINCSSCLEDLLAAMMGESREDFQENLNNSFLCATSYATFKKIDNVIYHLEYDENEKVIVLINVSDLSYQYFIVSSVLFYICEGLKNSPCIFWKPIIELILGFTVSDKLVYTLKQKKVNRTL